MKLSEKANRGLQILNEAGERLLNEWRCRECGKPAKQVLQGLDEEGFFVTCICVNGHAQREVFE